MSKPEVEVLVEDIPSKGNPKCEPEPPSLQPYHPKGMSEPQVDVLVEDILSKGNPKCEPEPPIKNSQSMDVSELPVEAPKDKEVSKPEVKVPVVDFQSMVILKKTERKPTVKAPVEISPSKETPISKVKAAVQKIEEKVSEEHFGV
ncbi:hypothetical protein L211DRAFT_840199 [Terfezia boudieri ATCC MYA-4762]|uniref:Uncharacterized protein n=1 Tax=Terfezia boudieri ATCC MYA-4762 TaxID=1051890 RepID=A0A3N4LG26_9PEZI|nr:hypothetical protein L211DRAFT_840199 [Terfezia boudieri ATCC MYA-4762]